MCNKQDLAETADKHKSTERERQRRAHQQRFSIRQKTRQNNQNNKVCALIWIAYVCACSSAHCIVVTMEFAPLICVFSVGAKVDQVAKNANAVDSRIAEERQRQMQAFKHKMEKRSGTLVAKVKIHTHTHTTHTHILHTYSIHYTHILHTHTHTHPSHFMFHCIGMLIDIPT